MKKIFLFSFLVISIMFAGCSDNINVDDQINKIDNSHEQKTIELYNQKDIDGKNHGTSSEDLKKEIQDEVNNMIEKSREVNFQCNNECNQGQTTCDDNEIYVCDMNSSGCYNWKLKEVCSNGCATGQCIEKEVQQTENVMGEVEEEIEKMIHDTEPIGETSHDDLGSIANEVEIELNDMIKNPEITVDEESTNVNYMDEIEKAIENKLN